VSVSVFIATSLDGFIARRDGAIDWLPMGGDVDHVSAIDVTNRRVQTEDRAVE
jgi:dihydrofolate reductase